MSDYTLKFDVSWKQHDFDQNHAIADLLCANMLTDCKLISEGKTIDVHRLVLAAASPFFLKMFLTPSSDKDGSVECDFSRIPYKDLYNICKYIYTGKVSLDHDELTSFIKHGSYLEVKGVAGMGIDFDQEHEDLMNQPMIEEYLDEAMEMMENVTEEPDEQPKVLEIKPECTERKLEVVKAVKRQRSSIKEEEELKLQVVPVKRSKRLRKYRSQEKIDFSEEYADNDDENKMKCAFCQREFNNVNTIKNHERFCPSNPERKISRCPICNAIVKPGSMTFHKRSQHGYVPKSRIRRAKTEASTSVMKKAGRPKLVKKLMADNDGVAVKMERKLQVSHAKKPRRSTKISEIMVEEDYDPFESSFEDLI